MEKQAEERAEMTIEEAIERLEGEKRCVVGACDDTCKYWETHECHKTEWQNTQFEAINTSIEALEKQIPKKSKCYEDKFIHCPSCGIGFGYKWECYPTKVNDYSHIQYCYGCGQKILWEGEEE